MGRSYWFECSKCGYRAKVSGRADRGVSFAVQTIVCRDCKQLYDAVTRMKLSEEMRRRSNAGRVGFGDLSFSEKLPPTFQAALNRLTVTGEMKYEWIQFPLRCPAFGFHRAQPWNDPGKCPRCGVYLERTAVPYRLWD